MQCSAEPCRVVWKYCSAMQSCAEPCSSLQSHAIPCRAVQIHSEACRAMQSRAEFCRSMQFLAELCRAMQFHAEACRAMQFYAEACSHAVPCRAMQFHAAACRGTLTQFCTLIHAENARAAPCTSTCNASRDLHEHMHGCSRGFARCCMHQCMHGSVHSCVHRVCTQTLARPRCSQGFAHKYMHRCTLGCMHKHLHSCVHQHALRGLARAHAQVAPTGSHAALHPDVCNKKARMAPCTSTSTAACIASASRDLHEHMHRCSHGFCMLLHAPMHAWLRAQAQLCASRLHAEISADAGKSLLAEPCTGAGRVACAAPVQLPKAAFPPAGIECPRGARNLPGMVQEGEPFSEEATQFTKELVLQREVGTAACRAAERCRAPGRGWGGKGGEFASLLRWVLRGEEGMQSSCGGCKKGCGVAVQRGEASRGAAGAGWLH